MTDCRLGTSSNRITNERVEEIQREGEVKTEKTRMWKRERMKTDRTKTQTSEEVETLIQV